MSKIRLGLAGCGNVGQRHLKAIREVQSVALAGIADPSSAAIAVAEDFGVPCFPDVDSLLASTAIDGLIIATPTEHHLDPTLAALRYGTHALVEKPITSSVAEANEIIALSETSQRHVLVGHHRRYYAQVNKAREIVQGGSIGKLVSVTGQWNVRKHDDYYAPGWRKRWQAGPILTNLIHDMDLLRYICGDIRSINAETSNIVQGFEKEDAAAMIIGFQNGALGSFTLSDQSPSPWSWECATGENAAFPPSHQNAVRFMGTTGALEFPNLILWQHSDTPVDWRYKIQKRSLPMEWDDAFISQIKHFASVIRGDDTPRISAADATATLGATLAVYQSAQSGNRIYL